MPGIDYTIGAKMSGFHAAIQGAMSGITGMTASIAKVASPIAAIAGVAGLGAAFGKAISAAAEMESLETAFMPLLGSAKAAQERIAELSRFAAETPFEMPEIATASRVLETLTRGALSTGEGLRLVGDVAAATNQPFNEIATTIGRLYDGLDSGRPVGEAMARLQELGVISGDTRGRLEALQAEGVKGADAWAVAAGAMGRFSGGMALQSQTWSGKLSTLKDNIGLAFAAFGTPIIDAVKPYLDNVIGATGTLATKATEFGSSVANALLMIGAAFQTDLPGLARTGLAVAFMDATNALWQGFRGAIAGAGQLLLEFIRFSIGTLQIITTKDFWVGLGQAIAGAFVGAIAILQAGIAEAMELARPLAEIIGLGDSLTKGQESIREGVAKHRAMAMDRFSDAGDAIGGDPARIVHARLKFGSENVIARYQAAFAKTADLIDSSGARSGLDSAFAAMRKKAEENAAASRAAKEKLDGAINHPGMQFPVLKPSNPKPGNPAPKTDDPQPYEAQPAAQAAARQIQADRLRQIGGYVGRGLDAGKDRIAERTEQWTRKTSEGITKLVTSLTGPKPANTTGAVF